MNYSSLGLAALGATVAYFAFGFLVFWLVPALINESRKYPDVFRSKEKMMSVMPIGMAATLMAIVVVAIIFAMIMPHPGGSSTTEGARLGVLIGIFVVCAFVLHNYGNDAHKHRHMWPARLNRNQASDAEITTDLFTIMVWRGVCK